MRVEERKNVFDLKWHTWFDGDGNGATREGARMEVSAQRA